MTSTTTDGVTYMSPCPVCNAKRRIMIYDSGKKEYRVYCDWCDTLIFTVLAKDIIKPEAKP